MKYSDERNRMEKENPLNVVLTGIAFVIFVVLFCVIVWSITHRGSNDIVISNTSVVTDSSNTETPESTDEVAPVESSSEEDLTGDEGIDYNDVSNDMGLVFTAVEDMVTAVDVTNLRSEPSTDQGTATVITQLRNGEKVKRIGKEETTGWSKLIYDGQIVYAATNFLTVVEEEE